MRIESPGDRSAKTTPGTLFVALAEEQVESRVSQGENSGHVLQHVAVTRVLKSAGTIDLRGPSVTKFAIPLLPQWGAKGFRVVAFIQDPISGHVLGAEAEKVKS